MEIKKIDSREIAEHLIARAFEYRDNYDLNNTKINKMLYIVYGLSLLKNNNFFDENVHLWPFGPVFPKVQNHIQKYGFRNGKLISDITLDLDIVINITIKDCEKNSASSLSDWSHKDKSPWDICVRVLKQKWNSIIDDNLIKFYFENNWREDFEHITEIQEYLNRQ